jgi:hypothetical protein
MRSKIKIRTSSCHTAKLALWRDEVRTLIFDDPAEQQDRKCTHFRSAQIVVVDHDAPTAVDLQLYAYTADPAVRLADWIDSISSAVTSARISRRAAVTNSVTHALNRRWFATSLSLSACCPRGDRQSLI